MKKRAAEGRYINSTRKERAVCWLTLLASKDTWVGNLEVSKYITELQSTVNRAYNNMLREAPLIVIRRLS